MDSANGLWDDTEGVWRISSSALDSDLAARLLLVLEAATRERVALDVMLDLRDGAVHDVLIRPEDARAESWLLETFSHGIAQATVGSCRLNIVVSPSSDDLTLRVTELQAAVDSDEPFADAASISELEDRFSVYLSAVSS